jgi:hypothetical protein
MARNRNWDSLSPSYRSRLARSGISRGDYESGASLESARGHKSTPEHPERAESNAQRYSDYLRNRNRVITEIQQIKEQLFSGRPKWNRASSLRYIKVDADTGKTRTLDQLRGIRDRAMERLENDYSEFEEIFAEDLEPDRASFYYH